MFCLAIHPDVRGPELLFLVFWDPTSAQAVWVPESRILSGSHSHDGIVIREPLFFQARGQPIGIANRLALRCIVREVITVRDQDDVLISFNKDPNSTDIEPPRKLTEATEEARHL